MQNAPFAADDSDLLYLRRSFIRHLAANGRSAATRRAYATAIAQLEAFLVDHRPPTRVTDLQPDQLEAFVVSLYAHGLRPTTILARFHALVRFFEWLVNEGELAASPITSIRAPAAALPKPRVLAGEEIAALVAACAGPAFEDLRDAAMIRLFCETGLRRSELAALQLDDVDLELNAVYVAGVGRPPRAVPFDRPTACQIDHYLGARVGHPWAHLPHLWLGRRRALTERGVAQALRHRGELAGMPNLHAHQLRHTFVQQYLAEGGQPRDLMRLAGWKSRQLLGRYRATELHDPPRDARQPLSLGDRL